jgi:hypothetical protein
VGVEGLGEVMLAATFAAVGAEGRAWVSKGWIRLG